MSFDPVSHMNAALRHITAAAIGQTLTSGSETCDCVLDSNDVIQTDGVGMAVVVTQTTITLREGAITRPTIGATVTTTRGDDAPQSWIVRSVQSAPGLLRMWSLVVSRA